MFKFRILPCSCLHSFLIRKMCKRHLIRCLRTSLLLLFLQDCHWIIWYHAGFVFISLCFHTDRDLNTSEAKTNGAIKKIKDGICNRDLLPLSCADELLILRFFFLPFSPWNAAVFYKRVTGSLFSRLIKGNSVLISSLKQSAEERKYSAALLARKNRAFLFHLKSVF